MYMIYFSSLNAENKPARFVYACADEANAVRLTTYWNTESSRRDIIPRWDAHYVRSVGADVFELRPDPNNVARPQFPLLRASCPESTKEVKV